MKTITRLYILQFLLIGAVLILLAVFKINSMQRLELFLKSSGSYHVRIVESIMKMDQEVFMRPLRDNSEWDETVDYIAHPTLSFEEECLITLPPTFSFDYVWVFGHDGEPIFDYGISGVLPLDTLLPGGIFFLGGSGAHR